MLEAARQSQADTATQHAIGNALALIEREDDSVETDQTDETDDDDVEDADPVLGQTLPSRALDALETYEQRVQQLVAAIQGGQPDVVRGLSVDTALLQVPLKGGKAALHLAVEAGHLAKACF